MALILQLDLNLSVSQAEFVYLRLFMNKFIINCHIPSPIVENKLARIYPDLFTCTH